MYGLKRIFKINLCYLIQYTFTTFMDVEFIETSSCLKHLLCKHVLLSWLVVVWEFK